MPERPVVGRRAVLAGVGGAVASAAGCISMRRRPPGGQNAGGGGGGGGGQLETLRSGGSSTVYPIVNRASSFWNSNRPASDQEYWGPGQYDIVTDERLADYWGDLYGFESGDDARPPFEVSVGLSHSGTGLEKLGSDQIDVGNSSAPVAAEFPEMEAATLEKYTDHVVGVDAQPIVVSSEIYDAGVTELTADQVRAIYRAEITDWGQIDAYEGPDRAIQAVGRSVGSGTDTAFRTNMLGAPDAEMPGVDARKGQNQRVKSLVERSDNAIAYMALSFVDQETTPAIALSFDGTTYVPGENLSDPDYPMARDLHCYTWEGTSEMEAAFLRMVISDFGQQNFVAFQGYSKLTDERQAEEMGRLPDTR